MIRKHVLFVLVVLVACLGAPAARSQDAPLIDTTFFLTFVPNIQFAPVYVAQAKGYFEDAGFNVSTEYADEPLGVNLIAANERQFGMIGGEQVITARANGLPIVFVYEWFQEFPVGIVAPVESGIETVEDLRERRVGIPGRFGASYSALTALLSAAGMTENDINLEEIGFNAPEVICVGGVEASVIYINNEPLQIEQRAAEGDCGSVTGVTVIPVSSAADLVSNGIATNETMIAQYPDQVTNMVGAFDRAVREVINNPAEAYLLSAPYIENLPLSKDLEIALELAAEEQAEYLSTNSSATRADIAERRAALFESLAREFDASELIQFRVLLSTIELWDADQLGYTDPASWETTQQTLLTMGFLEEPITNLNAAYTNDFLPELEQE